MWMLLTCLVAHALLADLMALPWWVPNLTVAGLVLAVVRSPQRWLALSALAGLFTILPAARLSAQMFASYLALGWVVKSISAQWDASDPRVLYLLAAAACMGMTLYAVWLDGLWLWPILGWALAHTALTILTVPIIQRLSLLSEQSQ